MHKFRYLLILNHIKSCTFECSVIGPIFTDEKTEAQENICVHVTEFGIEFCCFILLLS